MKKQRNFNHQKDDENEKFIKNYARYKAAGVWRTRFLLAAVGAAVVQFGLGYVLDKEQNKKHK